MALAVAEFNVDEVDWDTVLLLGSQRIVRRRVNAWACFAVRRIGSGEHRHGGREVLAEFAVVGV